MPFSKFHLAHKEVASFIGSGPSIRARARLALVLLFIIMAPILWINVVRTEGVSQHSALLLEYEDFWRVLLNTEILAKNLDIALNIYSNEMERDNGQNLLRASEAFKQGVKRLVSNIPTEIKTKAPGYLESMVGRLDALIKRSLEHSIPMAKAKLSLINLEKELTNLERQIVDLTTLERKNAVGVLATVGRDQLILFLILLFAMPIFIIFIPHWIVVPLSRIKQLALRIESHRLQEIVVSGKDEISQLARVLQAHFNKQEDLDHKKSSKIFELRNVLRSVINRVKEPVYIIDKTTRINYTNESGANLLGLPPHQLEGTMIVDHLLSPDLSKAIEDAFEGDIREEAISLRAETTSGRSLDLNVKIGMVRNRDGEVSRVVVICV